MFTSLSGLLGQCELGAEYCVQIEGIDADLAIELSRQFGLAIEEQSAAHHAEFCDAQLARRVPYRDAEEFALELDRYTIESNGLRAATFVAIASHVLDAGAMQNLMTFANGDFRRSIQEGRVDFASMIRARGQTPEQFIAGFCTSSVNSGSVQ